MTDEPLLIGISARSLLNMSNATRVLKDDGLDAYKKYQHEHRTRPLRPGVAYRFVQRMLSLNSIAPPDRPLVELAVISHMDPDAGCRVMNSMGELGVQSGESVFTSGGDVTPYLSALGVRLYLSFDEDSVESAIDAGLPAGRIMTRRAITDHDTPDGEIRIAFDFDGCLSGDDSDQIYHEQGLSAFEEHEWEKSLLPLEPGPMYPFIEGLSNIQKAEARYLKTHDDYKKRLKIAICTARSAVSGVRVMNTLDSWGVDVDEAFYMGGHDKTPVLTAYRPHLFLDDNPKNIESVRTGVTAVHVPFGLANKNDAKMTVSSDDDKGKN